AVLAILLYPRLRNMSETLIVAICLGVVDEAYQYLWLIPADPGYYDFNDVILNCLGAGLGLLLLRLCDRGDRPERRLSVWKSPVWRALFGVMAALAVLNLAGQWSVFPRQHSRIVLMPQYPAEFWSTFYEKSFHIVHPVEGLVAVVVLLGMFHWLLRRATRFA
ncbi:MAG: VanZ family protein, partial [Saprospiraceae bacterium]|nr:VanZ family protein [Saprospiraceae bacterium]